MSKQLAVVEFSIEPGSGSIFLFKFSKQLLIGYSIRILGAGFRCHKMLSNLGKTSILKHETVNM